MTGITIVFLVITIAVFIVLFRSLRIVPQKQAWLVERLGRYQTTLGAGLHLLVPFVDRVAYKQNLKETAVDVPPQQCVTRDNIIVEVDGILYLQVVNPVNASYGIANYLYACVQLAQTTLRSEIGKLELDRTFEERAAINSAICAELDKASDPWGVKVTRYEIKTISPPASVLDAMEKQMRAEREKRALIAESEGERQSRINRAEGEKQEAIALSEGEMQRRINEATGHAEEIRVVAEATAAGIRTIADAIGNNANGRDAVNLRLAEQYIKEFGNLAKEGNTMILPADLANVSGFIRSSLAVLKENDHKE
ncbi:MAG: SPFH/Band 7/PHB domain protein [Lentisphaeria bacterium]|nr:SPFH/Band 7/PHB domain protein [Lentisphaeria bacterium]